MRDEDLNVSPLMVAEYNETTSMKVGRALLCIMHHIRSVQQSEKGRV